MICPCWVLLAEPFGRNADARLLSLLLHPAPYQLAMTVPPSHHPLPFANIARCYRSEALERALQTVVSNGLRAGWLDLGHEDSEVMRIIGELPGQPFALRKRDGTEEVDESLIDLEEVVAEQAQSSPVVAATAVPTVSDPSKTPSPIAHAPRDEAEATPNPS